jgi:hypothetical protein
MNAHNSLFKITGVVLVAVAGTVAAVACSSSSNNNTPTNTIEAGASEDSSSSSSSGGPSSSSSSSSGGSSEGGSSSGGPCIPDGGAEASCNSCATIGGDAGLGAYNTCSSVATVNCTPFNNAARGVPSPLPTP